MRFTIEGNVITKITMTVDAPDGETAQQMFRSITGGSVTGIQPAFSFIDFVTNGEDWEGIYLDGKLVDQGHELPPNKVLEVLGKALGVQVSSREVEIDGYLPQALSDIGIAHDAQG